MSRSANDPDSPTGDPLIAEAERASQEAGGGGMSDARAADLFDIRRIIGGLLGVYGLILLILGLGASDADIDRATGINVNLWTGVALLAAAIIFIAWALLRPLSKELERAKG